MHIGGGLPAFEVAEFAYFVVEIFGIAFEQHKLAHVVVPHIGVFSVFLGQGHSVEYMAYASVISGQNEFQPFVFVGDLRETFVQRLYAFYSGFDVFLGVGDSVGR